MSEHEKYLCTRPMLASRLMAAGFEAKKIPNPWCPDLKAWEFPASVELCAIAAAFYQEIGKPVPKNISEYLKDKGAV